VSWFGSKAAGSAAANQHRQRPWAGWTLLAAGLVVAAAGLILALAVVVPRWLYPPLLAIELGQVSDPARRIELETNRLRLQNDARATMLQGLAGVAVFGGAIVAARQLRLGRDQLQHNLKSTEQQLELSRREQLTERFTRAIDQLGKGQLEVVLGGIYALERIAHDSGDDRPIIAEVLAAYVRTHAPWPPSRPGQWVARASLDELPSLQTRAANVQAAVTVLGRGEFGALLDLRLTDLRNADLKGAKLKDVRLYEAGLQGARLQGADLHDARLVEANLQRARLNGANLQRARLNGANLQGAWLQGANLQGAQFDEATFQGALADGTTNWPDGFDPRAAGVLSSEGDDAEMRP
jgi:hypothetical protein